MEPAGVAGPASRADSARRFRWVARFFAAFGGHPVDAVVGAGAYEFGAVRGWQVRVRVGGFCLRGVESEVLGVVFAVAPVVVGASAMTQAGLAARLGAGVAAATPRLSAVVPVGVDIDSAAFAALAVMGAAFVGIAGEYGAGRGVFSDAQWVAGAMAVAGEAMRAVARIR
ncbi:hypothetical protein LAUMK142_01336 [Mycobacterium pseudokansasii]|uniref:Uncharacterized protein n=1 Tax=Mycobacterium pseudokansasii TaxID=2341080 RepID=A0A498QK42_9MYCO|nr:hypothetical protein LAUMK142_01336 [Mycobacterium pseudokansasii]